jgi:hypothetical protein
MEAASNYLEGDSIAMAQKERRRLGMAKLGSLMLAHPFR